LLEAREVSEDLGNGGCTKMQFLAQTIFLNFQFFAQTMPPGSYLIVDMVRSL